MLSSAVFTITVAKVLTQSALISDPFVRPRSIILLQTLHQTSRMDTANRLLAYKDFRREQETFNLVLSNSLQARDLLVTKI